MFIKGGLGPEQVEKQLFATHIQPRCVFQQAWQPPVLQSRAMSSENQESDAQMEYEDEKQVGLGCLGLSWPS